MREAAVISFIADDRPGLVELLATTIKNNHGNWQESQLAHMTGKFAGIIKVNIEQNETQGLCDALEALQDNELTVQCTQVTNLPPSDMHQGHLSLIGNDRPGIIQEIASAMARYHLNIVEMQTVISSAPMAGHQLFAAEITFEVPAELKYETVLDEINDIADALDLDITLDGIND
ncbi:MAG: ACT domain-containing protein [Pseudomonadales bacterium]